MATFDDLINFSGEEGEDALRWYKSFLNAVGPFGERGMLNYFPLYMEPYSPAQAWCDELSDEVLSSWAAVDRQFRQRWLRHRRRTSENTENSELPHGTERPNDIENFQKHHLTDDAIFGPTGGDIDAMNKVIIDWAESHAKLGDAALLQATVQYLPPFIRAFLQYQSGPPTTFQALCTRVMEITDPILEFEYLRRQQNSVEWEARSTPRQGDNLDPDNSTRPESTVDESDRDDTTMFFPPEELEETVSVLVTKAQMADMVYQAIRTLRKYKPSEITIDAACMTDIGFLYYCNAVRARGQFQPDTVIGKVGTRSTLWQCIFRVHYQGAVGGSGRENEAIATWESYSDSTNTIKGECIYKANHTYHHYPGNGSAAASSGNNFPYYGGFIQIGNGSTFPHIGISSFTTTLYLLLSAYLAEGITTDARAYKEAAIESANWIKKWAYDETSHLAKIFHWSIYQGQAWGTAVISPHVTGAFIEGLCVLADATGELKWRNLAIDICDAVMAYPSWHNEKGIFIYVSPSGPTAVDDSNIFRGLLIRGLSVAYRRNPTNKRLRYTIRSYINTQFNALRDGGHSGGSYPVVWTGPHGGPYVHGQLAALEVLMATVIVNHC